MLQQAQQNPELADQLRQRLQQSGLTAEQIRARLQAFGYPSNLLDAYLGAAQAGQVVAAQALGLSVAPSCLSTWGWWCGGWRRRARCSGWDAFRCTTTQFLPLLSGPVPADYGCYVFTENPHSGTWLPPPAASPDIAAPGHPG